jgi:hypothetical protein
MAALTGAGRGPILLPADGRSDRHKWRHAKPPMGTAMSDHHDRSQRDTGGGDDRPDRRNPAVIAEGVDEEPSNPTAACSTGCAYLLIAALSTSTPPST